jgi:L-threonylcarbamoyladenylate synthase
VQPPDRTYSTVTRPYCASAIAEAAALIRAGEPVAVPTETVYGLAGDAGSGEAIARVYAAKGRPAFNPLIVHLLDLAEAERIALIDLVSRRLAELFWPGPLTLVVPLRPDAPLASLTTAGLGTVALRAPAHPAMRGRSLASASWSASNSRAAASIRLPEGDSDVSPATSPKPISHSSARASAAFRRSGLAGA